ncbi:MAG: hypothetical protein RBU30_11680 [Polyangia bacterium]|jgi:hypothetical protein|nr:hypothetical protein [Polyangia bacterium]
MRLRYSSRLLLSLGLGLLLFAGPPREASAKLLELTLKVHGGGFAGLYGTEDYDPLTGPVGEVAGKDFFKERRGAAFGATLGVEVLFVDLVYEFYQFADSDGLSSTLNNFLAGFDWDFRAGESWVITPYLLVGFGLATQNNSWLQKKYPQIALEDLDSRLVQLRLGVTFERRLGRFFRLGFEAGAGYHYAMQTATAANDLDGHSHGFHVMGNIYLAFVWNVFEKKAEPRGPHMDSDPARTPPARGAPPGAAPPPRQEQQDPLGAPAPVQEPPPAEREAALPVREPPPAEPAREVSPPASDAPRRAAP